MIEGYRELLRASEGAVEIELLFICEELFLGENEPFLIEHWKNRGTHVFPCTKAVFQKISYRDRPDGLLAVAKQLCYTLADVECSKDSFILIAESIEKPGNLGTILRSADAAGVDSLIVCDRCTDIHNPNVVRASVGTLFSLPVVETTSQEALNWLRMNQVRICATTPSAERNYTQEDLTGSLAIVVGSEQYGLSSFWLQEADLQMRIPMRGHADSLNVATATTLVLFERVRQIG